LLHYEEREVDDETQHSFSFVMANEEAKKEHEKYIQGMLMFRQQRRAWLGVGTQIGCTS
jgi:hypothetical protein